ncbi:MAG TPA: hypothetical protein VLF69_02270 [Candidatus Saccharimonadales bacterium]|nr:hypothetical protein [Candidatus Saccharimonadales bacterium]
MDFRQTAQPTNARPLTTPAPADPGTGDDRKPKRRSEGERSLVDMWMKGVNAILLIGVAVLLVAVALGLGRGQNTNESKYVTSGKYQAVFLNNGQVYFGHIASLNTQYVRMTDIFYLTQSGSNSSNYSLVKLGCQQIHDPTDAMVINRSQVTFWENLEDKGKVVASINQFKKQNPNGPDCTQVSNQTQASTSNTQGTGADTNTSNTTK